MYNLPQVKCTELDLEVDEHLISCSNIELIAHRNVIVFNQNTCICLKFLKCKNINSLSLTFYFYLIIVSQNISYLIWMVLKNQVTNVHSFGV